MNDGYLRKLLRDSRLRSDLSEEEIIRAFRMMQDHPSEAGLDIARHENDCRNLVNIFLYGILEKRKKIVNHLSFPLLI